MSDGDIKEHVACFQVLLSDVSSLEAGSYFTEITGMKSPDRIHAPPSSLRADSSCRLPALADGKDKVKDLCNARIMCLSFSCS